MKVKTIKKVLKGKVKEWLDTITDTSLRNDLILEGVIITGGAIASMWRKETVNDFDVYFKSKSTVERIARYYGEPYKIEIIDGEDAEYLLENHLNGKDQTYENIYTITLKNLTPDRVLFNFGYGESGHEVPVSSIAGIEVPRNPYSALFFTANAITLTNQMQLIIRFYGKAEEIHENFDFIHLTNWYDSKGNELHLNIKALEYLNSSELKYQGSLYPLTSIIRTKKYMQRGYTVSAGEYLKMIFQCSLLDLTNPAVLADQLIGVDIVYFNMLIDRMLKAQEDPNFKVTSEWVGITVNAVFDEIDHDED